MRLLRRVLLVLGVLVVASCTGGSDAADRADTRPVRLGSAGPGGAWEVVGSRRGGVLCTTLRSGDRVQGERCGAEATDRKTWEVLTVGYASRVVVIAPLPSSAVHVRLDGVDGSIVVVDARTAAGFPGRFLLTEVESSATPAAVRVFGRNGRAVVPTA
jgi:hypothetical protein